MPDAKASQIVTIVPIRLDTPVTVPEGPFLRYGYERSPAYMQIIADAVVTEIPDPEIMQQYSFPVDEPWCFDEPSEAEIAESVAFNGGPDEVVDNALWRKAHAYAQERIAAFVKTWPLFRVNMPGDSTAVRTFRLHLGGDIFDIAGSEDIE